MKAVIYILFFLMFFSVAEAYRIPRPEQFRLPWTDDQMKKHNDAHEDMWNLQNGQFNFDIVTTSKDKANNGDIWFIQTGNTVRLQFRANNHVWTISPDGV
jgi:hypothetical protein